MQSGSLVEAERRLIAQYGIIEDPQERLQALLQRRDGLEGVREEEKIPAHEVVGCSSRIWLVGKWEAAGMWWRVEAASPMVRALAGIAASLCQGHSPQEIVAWKPVWVAELGLERSLSSTRRQGLEKIHQHLRCVAARFLSAG